jgi:hypothetical protein
LLTDLDELYELGEGLLVKFIASKINGIETNCSDFNEHIITKKNYEPLCPECEEKKEERNTLGVVIRLRRKKQRSSDYVMTFMEKSPGIKRHSKKVKMM